jgi:quinol monooxygenase YgiN
LLEAKEGQGKNLMDILLELVLPTREEDGNIAYVPHFSADNPDKILFDELWIDKNALDNHFKQPHMRDLLEKIDHLLTKPLVLETYKEILLGD